MSADVYQAASREIDRLRQENHRLGELVKVADIVHIRLRDALHTALARVDDEPWVAEMRKRWLP